MDINYFLLLRGKYNSMLSNINDMIETCIEIDEYNEEYKDKELEGELDNLINDEESIDSDDLCQECA